MELYIKEIWRYATRDHLGDRVHKLFVDGELPIYKGGYPIRIISETSLQHLDERLGEDGPVPLNWFRPHIVLAGLPKPFDEDHLDVLSAEGLQLVGGEFSAMPRYKTGDPNAHKMEEGIRRAIPHRQWKYREQCDELWFGRYYTVKGAGLIREGMRFKKIS